MLPYFNGLHIKSVFFRMLYGIVLNGMTDFVQCCMSVSYTHLTLPTT